MFAVTSNGLHRSPSFIGVVGSAQGVGAVLGGVTAARLIRRVGELRLAGIGVLLFGLGDSMWLVPRTGLVLAGAAVAGLGIAWAVVALATAYQVRSPGHMQGRVAAAANMLFSVPQTISIAVGAALITIIDYRVEIVAMAIVFLARRGLPADPPPRGCDRGRSRARRLSVGLTEPDSGGAGSPAPERSPRPRTATSSSCRSGRPFRRSAPSRPASRIPCSSSL